MSELKTVENNKEIENAERIYCDLSKIRDNIWISIKDCNLIHNELKNKAILSELERIDEIITKEMHRIRNSSRKI